MPIALVYLVLYGFVFFVGACLGSFANTVVYRLPGGISPFGGHSFCPHCGKALGFFDKLPVVSYLWLGGKCRRCGEPIARRYLYMELAGGALALGTTFVYGIDFRALDVFLVLIILLTIAMLDHDTLLIPNRLLIALAVPVVASAFIFLEPELRSRLWGTVIVALPLTVVNLIKKDSFGGGDIKLCFVMGFMLGAPGVIVGAVLAIVGGGAAGFIKLQKDPAAKQMAFGPYLCAGFATAIFVAEPLVTWYLDLIS